MINHYTTWNNSLNKGKIKEQIFKEDFLNYFEIGFIDVSLEKDYQRAGVDIISQCLSGIDVKSYNDNKYISLEEMSIVERNVKGWIYTSKAKFFVFVSIQTRTMLILKNNDSFQKWWNENKSKFKLKTNQTTKDNDTWHSQYRNVPLKNLNVSWYKKNNN